MIVHKKCPKCGKTLSRSFDFDNKKYKRFAWYCADCHHVLKINVPNKEVK